MKSSGLLQNSLGSFPLPPPIFPGVQQMRPLAPHPSMFGQPAGLSHCIVGFLLNPVPLIQMYLHLHCSDILFSQVVFWSPHKGLDLFTGVCSFPTKGSRSMEVLFLEHEPLRHQLPVDPTTSLFPSRWGGLNRLFDAYRFWIFETVSILIVRCIQIPAAHYPLSDIKLTRRKVYFNEVYSRYTACYRVKCDAVNIYTHINI